MFGSGVKSSSAAPGVGGCGGLSIRGGVITGVLFSSSSTIRSSGSHLPNEGHININI